VSLAPTVVSIVPIVPTGSLVYTESGGLLVGGGGALDGLAVVNFAQFTSITEYPDRFEFIISPDHNAYWGFAGQAPNDSPGLVVAASVGDCEIAVNFQSDGSAGNRTILAGKWSPSAYADAETRCVGATYYSNQMYPRAMFSSVKTGTPHNPTPTWTDDQWVGFESIESACDFYWRELKTDPWVGNYPRDLDVVGGAGAKLGIGFGAQNGASATFKVFEITATYYASSVLPAIP